MPVSSRASGSSRLAVPAAYAAPFVLLAVVYTAAMVSNNVPLDVAARTAVASVLPGAFLGTVSLRLARRWPWREAGRSRLATRVLPAVLGLTVASTAGWVILVCLDAWVVHGRDAVHLPATAFLLWQFVINGLVHTALTGIGYAWHTAGALQDARDLAARAELLRSRAELELMRSQLQPHFVNNTLHALLGLVRRDPALAENALEKLGELLRFGQWVHQSGRDWVPLSREWDFVRSYLELEGMRLGSRLRVSLEADDAALDVTVPPFSLQPIVENAILHGIAPRASGGCVAVSARRSDGRLRLAVADDGPGSSADAIAASSRIGLRLLQERLAALYDGRAHLVFESPAGGGFRVFLDLPDDPGLELA